MKGKKREKRRNRLKRKWRSIKAASAMTYDISEHSAAHQRDKRLLLLPVILVVIVLFR